MPAEPITHLAVKYPAPICDRCALPMLTATTVRRRAKSEPLKVTYYWCQKCRCTLGATAGTPSILT
jgi:hypothetical protein